MTTLDRRLDKLAEHFTPRLTQEFVDRAIAALETDPNADQVDGVPIWQVRQLLDKEIARLKAEDDDNP